MPDRLELDPVEQRVLGALLEKQRTVPDSYPLSLNGLRTACNQATSRDPVTDYDDNQLVEVLGRLRDRELVRFVKVTGIRVVKYHQRLEERLELDPARAALITVLLLRGPQSAGELKTRTERLHPFTDRAEVERTLQEMSEAEPPLTRELPRRAGQHDPRWIQLLGGEPSEPADSAAQPPVDRESVLASGAVARDRKVGVEYDRLADAYADALGYELADKPFDRWLLDRLADDAVGGQALDVGCGPGQVAGHLVRDDLSVTGLDLSSSMISIAADLWSEVQFVQGSFSVPPMPRGGDPRAPGWALVTAWYAFVHLAGSEVASTVAALARVVRPGGVLAFATHVGNGIEHPGQLFGVDTELDFVLHDPEKLITAAEAAGLVDIEWYRRSPLPVEAQTERLYLVGRKPAEG